MPDKEYNEKEINLRDYFNVIIRRKKIIIRVFLIVLFISLVVSLFIQNKYQAVLAMSVPSYRITTVVFNEGGISQDSAKQKISLRLSLPMHKIFLKSPILIEVVLKKNISVNTTDIISLLRKQNAQFDTRDLKSNDALELVVQADNPDRARRLVLAWAQEYPSYAIAEIEKEADFKDAFLDKQMKILMDNFLKVQDGFKKSGLSEINSELATSSRNNFKVIYGSLISEKEINIFAKGAKIEDIRMLSFESEPKISEENNKRKIIITISLLGLVLGVFLAFYKEYRQRNGQL